MSDDRVAIWCLSCHLVTKSLLKRQKTTGDPTVAILMIFETSGCICSSLTEFRIYSGVDHTRSAKGFFQCSKFSARLGLDVGSRRRSR